MKNDKKQNDPAPAVTPNDDEKHNLVPGPRPGYKFVEIKIDSYVWATGPAPYRPAYSKTVNAEGEVTDLRVRQKDEHGNEYMKDMLAEKNS